ncbi:D-hexose-6-phosphate mutarotase [Luteococcus peritonei]|uniref:Putative glucose-6-phosphate 1-epimerase n=1 Tax=Luteococcus peritonei TaxID=88874 RepID=A0ABW4RTA2_9ACTN
MSEKNLPQGVSIVTENGLEAVRIDTELCTGLVYRNGAHVAEWTPKGSEPVLWMSGSSHFTDGTAIRGGIPLCFPWFGPGRDGDRTPAHGFARLSPWNLTSAELSPNGLVRLVFTLTGDDVADLGGFPADFEASYAVTMGTAMQLALTVRAGEQPLEVEEALHTYFAVGDARQVRIEGLDGADYLDKVAGDRRTQSGDVTFTAETDRVYFSEATTRIVDEQLGRTIVVEKACSANTVVWNPWVDKSEAMADFGDEEWTGMCCVETVNALGDATQLSPGASHTMSATISLT